MNYPYETYMRFLFFDSRKDTISSARTQSPFIEYVQRLCYWRNSSSDEGPKEGYNRGVELS